jgi:hypothetical protein
MTWPGLIDVPYLFCYSRGRSAARPASGASSSMRKPNRAELKAAIKQRGGVEAALYVPKGTLTTKQRRFAEAIAAGETGAAAYRQAYDTHASAHSQSNDATRLKRHPVISQQIEALKLANEAMAYADAESIRKLVIQSLIQTVIDPDVKAATKVAAAKVLGTVTEVAAFTERKQITNVNDSSAIREQIMSQLKHMILDTDDAETVDADALLHEISGEKPAESIAASADRTGRGDATFANEPHPRALHSNPLERSSQNPDGHISDEFAFMALNTETPPLGSEMEDDGGDISGENT